jgi:dTDP-glucose 4,6-dehydratase
VVRAVASGHPGPINLGNPEELSVLAIAELVREVAGSASEVVFVARPEDDPTVRQPDIALARSVLGWQPTVGIRDGLRRTLTWFADQLTLTIPHS